VQLLLLLLSSLFVHAGCDGVFGVHHIYERPDASDHESYVPGADALANGGPDAAAGCTVVDRFDGAVLSRWTPFEDAGGYDINFAGDQLVAKMGSSEGYAWVYSGQRHRMIGATATVEVLRAITGPRSETYFSLYGSGDQNVYFFSLYAGELEMVMRHNGNDAYTEVTYAPGPHRFWRFEHDVAATMLRFHTSPDGKTWTQGFATATNVPIGDMLIELGVGADGVPTAGEAHFDNLEICAR
jgi:hypothetical protein